MTSLITTEVTRAAKSLAAGHLCAIPTETVYGLAADATNVAAINRVYVAKGRPTDHPLIVHVVDFAEAKNWFAQLPTWAENLATKFWPGPMTLVGFKAANVLSEVTGGQDTVAVRVPAHPVAQELLVELKTLGVHGLVAPSANKFGHVSPTSAQHVNKDLGEYLTAHQDLILDGQQSEVGLESTIILVTESNPVILRPGAITKADIELATGLSVNEVSPTAPKVSGSLAAHYSPAAKVVLLTSTEIPTDPNGGFIGLANLKVAKELTTLLVAKDLVEYATNLYQALRLGDEKGLATIYVQVPEGDGLAVAIRDRLTRAAN